MPNPSFETHFDCNAAIIESAAPWCGINSVSYLNTCISHPYFSVPSQSFTPGFPSYQVPHFGNAYISCPLLYNGASFQPRYPHVPLIDTLTAGKIYCVTYYVSLWNDCKYSADKLGALFTTTPFNCSVSNQTLTTGYTPQVVSAAGYLYNDTLNWQEVSGTFIADGTEAYLTLGNFFTNAQHTITLSYPSGVRNVLDYYLDDVSVEEVEIAKAKNDTLINQGDSIIVGANNSEAALFSWQPSAGLSCTNCPNPKASPTITNTYTVTKTQCKSVTNDVITVTVSPVGIDEVGMPNVELRILPNPASDVLNVTSRFDFEKIELLSITGQVLLSEIVNSKTHQLQLQNFAEGIYFVKISYTNGMSVTKKVVKQ